MYHIADKSISNWFI